MGGRHIVWSTKLHKEKKQHVAVHHSSTCMHHNGTAAQSSDVIRSSSLYAGGVKRGVSKVLYRVQDAELSNKVYSSLNNIGNQTGDAKLPRQLAPSPRFCTIHVNDPIDHRNVATSLQV